LGREIKSMRSIAKLAWGSKPLKEAFQINLHITRFAIALLLGLVMLAGGSVQPAAAQGTADLTITKVADSKNVRIGENITYTITLTNLGPDTATGVVFGDPLPDPLNLVSFTCSQGSSNGGSFCSVESVPSGASVSATLVATPITNPAQSERRFTNTAFISDSATPDPNLSNNSATVRTHIVGKTP
jgi:large repetitive protein